MSNQENNTQLSTVNNLKSLTGLHYTDIIQNITDSVLEGAVDPLTILLFLKKFKKVEEEITKDKNVKNAFLSAASKYSQDKAFAFGDAKLQITSVHTSYDFKACGDPTWNNLNEIITSLTELKKARETQLKNYFPDNIKFGFKAPTVIIKDLFELTTVPCGEVVTLKAPLKYQQEGVKVTFNKK